MNKNYYFNEAVLYKMGLRSKYRELAFLGKPSVRCLKAHNSSYFETHLKRFMDDKAEFNIYHSVSTLFNMPQFTYNIVQRIKDQQVFFRNYNEYVIGYDLVFDFDSPNLRKAFDDCCVLRAFFLDNGVRCEMIFSGSKGFHLEIKGLPEVKGEDFISRVQLFRLFAERIKALYCLTTLDLAVYDYARIWKLPYSIDYRTNLVVLPLSESEVLLLANADDIKREITNLCNPERVLSEIRSRMDFYFVGVDNGKIFKLIKEVLQK